MTALSTTPGWTSPSPTVVRHVLPKPKAADEVEEGRRDHRLRGVRTRVATTVAMELAASWKPLMKSKTSATGR